MELDRQEHPAKIVLHGEDIFPVDEGQVLKIETSPGGEERLNEGPPAGKKWTRVRLTLAVVEEDA